METPYDEYVSDPAKPVPYLEHPPVELNESYMYGDQRFASSRTDVLTYRTEPLSQKLTVVGPITVRLQVSSTGTDSDFIVKLIDEGPGSTLSPGSQELVRGEPMRARFRKSFSNAEPLQSNENTAIDYTLPDVNHMFLREHRIVVQVQSSWFPVEELNPQSFVQTQDATSVTSTKATQHIFHRPDAVSSLTIQVMSN